MRLILQILLQSKTIFDCSLPSAIAKLLGKSVTKDTVHSGLVCKKCFKLIDEADELRHRLDEIKAVVTKNYAASPAKSQKQEEEDGNSQTNSDDSKMMMMGANGKVESEDLDENNASASNNNNNKENAFPKKILDIPSSDEDTSQVINVRIIIFFLNNC